MPLSVRLDAICNGFKVGVFIEDMKGLINGEIEGTDHQDVIFIQREERC